MAKKVWVYAPQAPKFKAIEKEEILAQVKNIINANVKLSKKVCRTSMRGNRVYLYELVKQLIPEGVENIGSLIDDKFVEFPYARITLSDTKGDRCSADWQRHNSQWITIFSGTLTECLNSIEDDNTWF
jgi:hypothetical protein